MIREPITTRPCTHDYMSNINSFTKFGSNRFLRDFLDLRIGLYLLILYRPT